MAEAESPRSTVKLIIKNPAASSAGDFELVIALSATVGELKLQLQKDYDGNPEPELQKLIFCGQLLKDASPLRDVLKNQDMSEGIVLHMVVKDLNYSPSPSRYLGRTSSQPSPSAPSRALSYSESPGTPAGVTPAEGADSSARVERSYSAPPERLASASDQRPGNTSEDAVDAPAASDAPPALGVSVSPHAPVLPYPHQLMMINPVYSAAYQAALAVLTTAPPQAGASGAAWPQAPTFPYFPYGYPSYPMPTYAPPPTGAADPQAAAPMPAAAPAQAAAAPNQNDAGAAAPPAPADAAAAVGEAGGAAAGGNAPARVVRLDLVLIFKLTLLVVVLNQDGSQERFLWLTSAAVVFYLHHIGLLTPLHNWLLAQVIPPQYPGVGAPAGEGEVAAAGGEAEERQGGAEGGDGVGIANWGDEDNAVDAAEGAPRPPAAAPQPRPVNMTQEIKTLLLGFLTSLLPGFNPAQHIVRNNAPVGRNEQPAAAAVVGGNDNRDHQD